MRYFLIWMTAGLLLAGCKDECFPAYEPELKVTFLLGPDTPALEVGRIYTPGGREVAFREGHYFLPLSLHADSVTYVFESPNRSDTLTLFYTRKFYFESRRCGYVVQIEPGYDATGRPSRGTLGVSDVTYSDYILFSGRRNVNEITIVY
jgi:hypothetical protein